MTKVISVSEAKNTLSAVLDWAVENGEGVIIKSRGEPKAAVLSYAEYEAFLALKEQERRREALRWMEEFAERQAARNADLSDKEVEQLADEITRETIQRLVDKGVVRFAE